MLMKAIVWTKYGSPDGLQLREVATPTPKDNEVLINVHATTAFFDYGAGAWGAAWRASAQNAPFHHAKFIWVEVFSAGGPTR